MKARFGNFGLLPLLFFVVLLGGGLVGEGLAQSRISARGNVGASFFRAPNGLSEALNSGVNAGLSVDFRLYRGFFLSVQGGYDQFTLNEETTLSLIGDSETILGDWAYVNGSLGLRYVYENESDAHPYFTIGVGGYQERVSNIRRFQNGEVVDANTSSTITNLRLGTHVGLGANFKLDDTYAVFFEPRYTFYDLRSGVQESFRFFSLRLGGVVHLYR